MLRHRRPGLEAHQVELPRIRLEAEQLVNERHALAKWRGLDQLSPDELRAAAIALEDDGLLTRLGLNRQHKQARDRLAAACPALQAVAGPQAAGIARQMAGHLERRESFLRRGNLRELAGPACNGIDTPWAELATVARWQVALAALGQRDGIGRALVRCLLTLPAERLQPLRRLAQEVLPRPADGLAVALDDSAGQESRARDLDELASLVAPLPPALTIRSWVEEQETGHKRDAAVQKVKELKTELDGLALPKGLVSPGEEAAAALARVADLRDGLRALRKRNLPDWARRELAADYPAGRPRLDDASKRLATAAAKLEGHLASFAELASPDWQRILGQAAPTAAGLVDLGAALGRVEAAVRHLATWQNLVDARGRAREAGLEPLAPLLERRAAADGAAMAAFERVVARSCLQALRARDTTAFTPALQLRTSRDTFRRDDRKKLAADRQTLKARLLRARPPAGSNAGKKSAWTEMALLRNELPKQKGFYKVRDLMDRACGAIRELKPCFMMSPLAVARFLKPGLPEFDLVVVDEASQMRPEDALGAFLRGKRVVVVGDPKQLPPTSFFDRGRDEGDDDLPADDAVEGESILELCLRSFQPARRLRWHYRSRHESLIAFSNRHLYDDQLIVFPAREPPQALLGVELVEVAGRYEAGRERRFNQPEAVMVAETALRLLRDHPHLTMGVIAVNEPQARLIEQEMRARARGDGDLEARLDPEPGALEPFFVKNLENVQGDERDVTLVSLTYGPSPEGAIHQRFGPIAGKFGHRRLNVLFTRARRKLVLFSSLRPEQIVVGPDTPQGVRLLQDYLRYARSGRLDQGMMTGRAPDSDFERAVARRLQARGWQVDCQVGVAGYFLDLAVRDPERPDGYLAGIECDGARWHSAKSARDRDRLRQDALESLGWTILRVWSSDWFRDPEASAEALDASLRAVAAGGTSRGMATRLVPLPEEGERRPPEVTAETPSEVRAEGSAEMTAAADLSAPPLPAEPAAPLDLVASLRRFREQVIFRDLPGAEPERCILRESLLREIVASGLDDPADFTTKIPHYLRVGTDGRQMRYLPAICELVAEATRPAGVSPSARRP